MEHILGPFGWPSIWAVVFWLAIVQRDFDGEPSIRNEFSRVVLYSGVALSSDPGRLNGGTIFLGSFRQKKRHPGFDPSFLSTRVNLPPQTEAHSWIYTTRFSRLGVCGSILAGALVSQPLTRHPSTLVIKNTKWISHENDLSKDSFPTSF